MESCEKRDSLLDHRGVKYNTKNVRRVLKKGGRLRLKNSKSKSIIAVNHLPWTCVDVLIVRGAAAAVAKCVCCVML